MFIHFFFFKLIIIIIIIIIIRIRIRIRIRIIRIIRIRIIIALKAGNRFFFFLQSPQVARAQPCANHVQHIERLSRATCRVTCLVVQRDSSAIKFDRAEITFILALSYWPNH